MRGLASVGDYAFCCAITDITFLKNNLRIQHTWSSMRCCANNVRALFGAIVFTIEATESGFSGHQCRKWAKTRKLNSKNGITCSSSEDRGKCRTPTVIKCQYCMKFPLHLLTSGQSGPALSPNSLTCWRISLTSDSLVSETANIGASVCQEAMVWLCANLMLPHWHVFGVLKSSQF